MILGIDYGQSMVGLAISSGDQSEALMTVARGEAVARIEIICKKEHVDKIVIGMPHGRLQIQVEEFGRALKEKLKLDIVYHDETLTSRYAAEILNEVGTTPKKKQVREHALAAALILQSYLDEIKHL